MHTQPCERVIRIVNEVDGGTHLPPPPADIPSCSTFIPLSCEENADAPEKQETDYQDYGFQSNLRMITNQKKKAGHV